MSELGRIKVLIVEDSLVTRNLLLQALSADPDVEVVAAVATGADAVSATKQHRPDVISMDVVLPDIDGVEATRQIMDVRPTAVVLVTALDSVHEDHWAMKALASGAVAAIAKPNANSAELDRYITTIKSFAAATQLMSTPATAAPSPSDSMNRLKRTVPRLIVLGASSGGPKALTRLLANTTTKLPAPILLVQHIPLDFFDSYLSWLAGITKMTVLIPSPGQAPQAGCLYVAPPNQHLIVDSKGAMQLLNTPPVNFCRPSLTELFRSAADWDPVHTVGIVLSGMGDDGAAGTRSLKALGSTVIAQDPGSCVVYGMPRAASAAGAATVLLEDMNALLCHWSTST